jgi:hypothetical protein
MRYLLIGLSLCVARPLAAEDCPTFALESDYLNGFFCGQLEEIIGPRTRTIEPSNPITTADSQFDDWLSISVIGDAYRVDPGRTLEMIQRIKDAGGEPTN